MKTIDLLILIIYVTLMVYVAYQARENLLGEQQQNLDDALFGKIVVEPDRAELKKALNEQLAPLNLEDYIDVSLGMLEFEPAITFQKLVLILKNKSTTYLAAVEWESSTMTTPIGTAHTLARVSNIGPVTKPPSIVPPGETLQEFFTIAHGGEGLETFIDPIKLIGALTNKDKPKESETIRLRLVFRLQPVSNYASQSHLIAVSCPYKVRLANEMDFKKWKSKRG
jgi:hypothetical protein